MAQALLATGGNSSETKQFAGIPEMESWASSSLAEPGDRQSGWCIRAANA